MAALAYRAWTPPCACPREPTRQGRFEPILARFSRGQRGYALEAFAAKGLTSRLRAAFVQQVLTNLAAAGYFLEGQEEKVVGEEIQTKYVLKDGLGRWPSSWWCARGRAGVRLWEK